jgi:hypothetical protein
MIYHVLTIGGKTGKRHRYSASYTRSIFTCRKSMYVHSTVSTNKQHTSPSAFDLVDELHRIDDRVQSLSILVLGYVEILHCLVDARDSFFKFLPRSYFREGS